METIEQIYRKMNKAQTQYLIQERIQKVNPLSIFLNHMYTDLMNQLALLTYKILRPHWMLTLMRMTMKDLNQLGT